MSRHKNHIIISLRCDVKQTQFHICNINKMWYFKMYFILAVVRYFVGMEFVMWRFLKISYHSPLRIEYLKKLQLVFYYILLSIIVQSFEEICKTFFPLFEFSCPISPCWGTNFIISFLFLVNIVKSTPVKNFSHLDRTTEY